MPDLERIKALFAQALTLPEGEERAVWLEARCAADAGLLQEVRSLLAAYSKIERGESRVLESSITIPEAQFGPYQASEVLGRGGTSAVFRAERVDGRFQQTVALKVMASFLSGPDFLRRFETERQLLASLSHPHIAHLLDGGVSSSGAPYLAMEYVEGERLDGYCDRNRMTIERRLRLFLQVTDAVDYVHRKLIVHRDLKPSNVLVTAEGKAKLLDFGASALLATQVDTTLTRSRMMTPRYASPERLRGEPASVTDDVFSLGVMLYELVTGAWPFGDPASGLSELRRAINDAAPMPAAAAVTANAAELRSARRRTLQKQLSGDLGAIVLKALEYDASRRYPAVRDLAADLEAYLAGLPVTARRPTLYYRVGKFVRRNWVAASAAALAFIGLSTAVAVAVTQARTARAEASKADSVNRFLSGMLSTFAEYGFDGEKYTVVQMLAAAEQSLETGPTKSLLVEATLRRSLAESYLGLARFADARKQLARAIPVFTKLGDRRELAEALFDQSRIDQNDGNLAGAVQGLEQSLELLRQLGGNAAVSDVFDAKLGLAEALSSAGLNRDTARAHRLVEEAVALGAHEPTISRTRVAGAMSELGIQLAQQGRTEEGKKLVLKALATGRLEKPGGAWELEPLSELQSLSERAGDTAGAQEYARESMDVLTHTAGPGHLMTAVTKIGWARLAARNGEVLAAAKAVDEAMPIVEAHASAASPNSWIAARDAAVVMRLAGRFSDAERYARQSLSAAQAQHLSDSDARLANSWQQLGNALAAENKIGEGIRCLEQAQAIYARAGQAWVASAETVAKRIAELRASAPDYSRSH